TVLVLLLLGPMGTAQHVLNCEDGRYFNKVFDQVSIDWSVKYGQGADPVWYNPFRKKKLYMDIYEPANDAMQERPLVILAFGGAFVLGDKRSPDIVVLAKEYAKRGYVVASIDYRLTQELVLQGNTYNAYKAVVKGMHDMRAAIRYFRKSYAEGNPYHINPNSITVGGVSAGAITALHAAYLDETHEIPNEIYDYVMDNGGLEGNSGNAGFSAAVNGVVNLCGAIGDKNWITSNDAPLVSMHGDEDSIVPYHADLLTLFDINLFVYGSAPIHEFANAIQLENDFYTYEGAGHVPFILELNPFQLAANISITKSFTGNFLASLTCAEQAATKVATLSENHPLPTYDWPLGKPLTQDGYETYLRNHVDALELEDKLAMSEKIGFYPNPMKTEAVLKLPAMDGVKLQLFTIDGRQVAIEYQLEENHLILNRNQLAAGMYIYQVSQRGHQLKGKIQVID
ncbi:MAG: carboxylesterase family protein, partial [Flammeovirgaceae bacterium]